MYYLDLVVSILKNRILLIIRDILIYVLFIDSVFSNV